MVQDLHLLSGAKGDVSSGKIISENVEKILNQCVAAQGKGGSSTGFSKMLS